MIGFLCALTDGMTNGHISIVLLRPGKCLALRERRRGAGRSNVRHQPAMMVRCYAQKDLHGLLALFHQSVHDIASRDYTPEQTSAWAPDAPDVEAWAQRLTVQATFVCEIDGEIVGFASVEPDGHLDLLYVHPGALRRGVARTLLARIVGWCQVRGIGSLFTEASVTAGPFFETCGFRVTGQQVVQLRGVAMPNIRMSRAL